MADFTSALYLGFRHPSHRLAPWTALTGGRPAVLAEPPGAVAVSAGLAALMGTQEALLLPSTLHLFMDLFALLATPGTVIWQDAGAYPIARWGAARAAAAGVAVQTFRHHDPAALAGLLARVRGRPVVLTDGLCPNCGRLAPLAEYLALVRRHRGLLVIDDTQALGVLGAGPCAARPYGEGGGGVARHLGLRGPELLIGASLAKGFGVPVAVLAGDGALLRRFAARSATRLHCSPPSAAVIAGAARALALNQATGEARRQQLLSRVRRLRAGLAGLGLGADGGAFPIQTLRPVPGVAAALLYRRLLNRGVRVLPLRAQGGAGRIGLLLSAAHRDREIDHCLAALAASLTEASARRAPRGSSLQPSGGVPCLLH